MPCRNPRAIRHIDPFDLNIGQGHVQLRLTGSHNSCADENHVVHLATLGSGSDDQTYKNR